jgi:hypothetical protein
MQTIKLYLVDQIAEVQIMDPAIFTVRNRTVYSRPIKVYQGVDNPIQVVVKNQDQKKVNLTGSSVLASIQDPVNLLTVKSYAVNFNANAGGNIQLGQGTFTFDANTINGLEQRFYKLAFSTTVTSTDTTRPVYIDDNYGVPLDLEILPAYYADTTTPNTTDTYTFDGGTL